MSFHDILIFLNSSTHKSLVTLPPLHFEISYMPNIIGSAPQIQLPLPHFLSPSHSSSSFIPETFPVPVLVSYGCHNQVPQSGWLHTTGIYSLTGLEAKSPKSRCQQAHAPLKNSLFLASLQHLLAIPGFLANGSCITPSLPPSVCGLLCVFVQISLLFLL